VLRYVLKPIVVSSFCSHRILRSSQAVFDLLDHFSRWVQHQKTVIIRDYRGGRIEKISDPERRAEYHYLMEQIPKVEGLLNSIDAELQAEAALITQAYARSLRGFETRMAALRRSQKRTDADLQPYYEYLHRIYADLDEPDGMEGVSTFIISPSMDHQIREHESVGRWTSAQSCWEVKLQDNADNLDLHLGLLRCLRSLGHYGRSCVWAVCRKDLIANDKFQTRFVRISRVSLAGIRNGRLILPIIAWKLRG
jgi:serine/threonine-protein kinase ATR